MTTYPKPSDPVATFSRANGTTEAHTTDHGRVISMWENVIHHGADPTGVLDSTAAFQAAINAAVGGAAAGSPVATRFGYSGCGKVYVPAGTYKITGPLEFTGAWGITFEGAGVQATKLVATGTMTQVLKLVGVSFSLFRGFSITGAGSYGSGSHSLTYVISWDWDPTLTVQSSSRCRFEDITIADVDYTYGFAIGVNSTSYDVSGTEYAKVTIQGNRALGAVQTTHTAAFQIGSGTAGNILNHYFRSCHVSGVKYGFYINNVSTVTIAGSDASNVEDFMYKVGPGQVTLRDARVEDSYHLVNSLGGASFTSHVALENCLHEPGVYGPSDGRSIIWKYSGSVSLKASTLGRNYSYIYPLHVFVSTDLAARQVYVHVDGVTILELSDIESVVEAAGSTHAQVWITSLSGTDAAGAIVYSLGPTSIGYNRDSMLTFGSTQAAGSSGTDQGNQGIRLSHATNAVTGSTPIAFATGGVDKWWVYQAAGDTTFYIRDIANARMQLSMLPGATSAAAITELASELRLLGPLNHDGTTVGFFGHAPSAQPSAYTVTNPTTDRALNVTADTTAQVAQVLGTLIADLQTLGVIG